LEFLKELPDTLFPSSEYKSVLQDYKNVTNIGFFDRITGKEQRERERKREREREKEREREREREKERDKEIKTKLTSKKHDNK